MFPLTRDRSRNRSAFGYRPTLNLIFGPNSGDTLDPRITFSRTSNATQFDSSGNLVYAPHNLLTQSESFDNSAWGKFQATISANVTTAPDGTTTADKMIEGVGAAAEHGTNRTGPIVITAGASVTLSVYAKADTRSRVSIVLVNGAYSVGARYVFNLSTGAVSAPILTGSPISYSASAQSVGGGWYRCAITVVLDTSSTTANFNIATDNGTSFFYAGDGVSGLFIWGAQLNIGTLQPYYPTTVKNLLGFAQEFDNAAWAKSNSTITANATAAPDGSMTGDKLVETTANAQHFCQQLFLPVASGKYTVSYSVKAAERSFAIIGFSGGGLGADCVIGVNLATGAVVSTAGAPEATSVVSLGNGWYRISITKTMPAASNCGCRVISSTDGTTQVYTGDGTSGIFIWGAQLSDSASLDPYVYNPVAAPTAAAYYGPRFDYDPATLAARGLLIEEQRTNGVANNTMQGASAPSTVPTGWQVNVGGLALGVVGIGTENGITYIDVRFSGTPTQTFANLRFVGNTQVAASNGQAWTNSFYCRSVAGGTTNISNIDARIGFRDSGGISLGEGASDFLSTISTASLSVARRSVTFTATSASTVYVDGRINLATTVGVAIDITLRIGLPQLELGAFATSVIPTTTAAATRTADVATMVGANFGNWYRQDEGTIYFEGGIPSNYSVGFPTLYSVNDTTANNNIQPAFNASADVINVEMKVGGSVVAGFYPAYTSGTTKLAFAYKINDVNYAKDGAVGTTDTTAAIPVVTQINLGANQAPTNFLNGHIRRIAYYQRRLTDAQLQAVTA